MSTYPEQFVATSLWFCMSRFLRLAACGGRGGKKPGTESPQALLPPLPVPQTGFPRQGLRPWTPLP